MSSGAEGADQRRAIRVPAGVGDDERLCRPRTTWALVTMSPLLSNTTPDPSPSGVEIWTTAGRDALDHLDEALLKSGVDADEVAPHRLG